MKKAFFIPVILIVLVSLACSVGGFSVDMNGNSNEEAAQTENENPLVEPTATNADIPTNVPSPTPEPVEATQPPPPEPTATLDAPYYFRDEFDGDSNAWEFEYITGNTQDQCEGPEFRAGRMWWGCPMGEETHLKVFNTTQTYEDVIVQAEVENFGPNASTLSLLCRVSDDGWYEFRFAVNGYYDIYRFDRDLQEAKQTPYVHIHSGATTLITPGLTTNTVAMDCSGDQFRFYANGSEIEMKIPPTLRAEFKRLPSGGVGLGYWVTPETKRAVDIGFNWFETLAP